MVTTPTLRELFRDDPDARVLVTAPRGDDDFGAFTSPTQESSAEDAEVAGGGAFELFDVPAAGQSGFTHFLDGAQKSRQVMFHGFFPVYLCHTSAGLLERIDSRMQPPGFDQYSGELEAYAPVPAADRLAKIVSTHRIEITDEDTGSTVREKIAKKIGNQREAREIALAVSFTSKERGQGWLLVDGGVGRILDKNPQARALAGLVKTHAKQYFRTRERVALMQSMKVGQRTSVFVRKEDEHQGSAAFSFYLKLRESATDGPMFGLVRIEMPALDEYAAMADDVASWILHERDPLSMPDPRHDRLLYPIRLVEMQLKARQPSDMALTARIG